MQWEMPKQHATRGADLYSTMWGTVAAILRRTATEAKRDKEANNGKFTNTMKGYERDGDFLRYLTVGATSPLRGALKKAGKDDEQQQQQWIRSLWWPYFNDHEEIAAWAKEAKDEAKLHARLTSTDSEKKFQEWVEKSLDEGSRELHKYIRDEKKVSIAVKDDGTITTDLNMILKQHTEYWQEHWKAHDEEAKKGTEIATKDAIKKIKERNQD